MPYILDNMVQDDIPQVAAIERLCFSMPWPISAYKRELKTPESNRYIILRFVPPMAAHETHMATPSEANLTSFSHPELYRHENGHSTEHAENTGRSLFSNLLPWIRNDATAGEAKDTRNDFPLVGYAGLWLMVDEAHVTTIGVHPHHRGQGAGELLFLGLADIASEMRAARMTLEVRVSNTSAQALYRKYGLEIAGVRRRYYSDNGEDAYIMWSEPIASAQFRERIATLRAQLTRRLQDTFLKEAPPARQVDPSHLQ